MKSLFNFITFFLCNTFVLHANAFTLKSVYSSEQGIAPDMVFISFSGSNVSAKVEAIYQVDIDPQNDGELDSEVFTSRLRDVDESVTMLLLDWEGSLYSQIKNNPHAEKSKQYVDNLAGALEIAKKDKSSIDIGYYGLPIDTEGTKREFEKELFSELYSKIDVFFPSAYLRDRHRKKYFARLNAGHDFETVNQYINDALQWACSYGNRVIPFVNHRYHPSGTAVAFGKIEQLLKQLHSAQFEDCKVDGIVWWNADLFHIRNAELEGVTCDSKGLNSMKRQILCDYEQTEDIQDYFNTYLKPVYDALVSFQDSISNQGLRSNE